MLRAGRTNAQGLFCETESALWLLEIRTCGMEKKMRGATCRGDEARLKQAPDVNGALNPAVAKERPSLGFLPLSDGPLCLITNQEEIKRKKLKIIKCNNINVRCINCILAACDRSRNFLSR
jgi:hypothetical protein